MTSNKSWTQHVLPSGLLDTNHALPLPGALRNGRQLFRDINLSISQGTLALFRAEIGPSYTGGHDLSRTFHPLFQMSSAITIILKGDNKHIMNNLPMFAGSFYRYQIKLKLPWQHLCFFGACTLDAQTPAGLRQISGIDWACGIW